MGSGRDKRKKLKPTAPGAGASKTEKKTAQADEKRQRRLERGADEDDIEALLARAQLDEASDTVRVEADCAPPSARVNVSLTALPAVPGKAAQLLLFGGECVDSAGKTRVFGDLFCFDSGRRSWSCVRSPDSPPPRSAHQAVAYKNFLYVFGGEFTSPNQERFHHYKDLWRLDTTSWAWEQLTLRGAPSARSGHRCVLFKNKLILFGGFFDAGKETKYFNDLYELDLDSLKWSSLGVPTALCPPPRSGCQLALHAEASQLYLYGGYRKEKAEAPAAGAGRGSAPQGDKGTLDVEKGTVMQDMWVLELAGEKVHTWSKVKRQGMGPGPRAGFSMAVSRGKAVLFGGVADTESKGGEVLISEFFNEVYAFAMDSKRWHPLPLAAGPAPAQPAKPAPAPAPDSAPAPPPAAPSAASEALHRAATRIQAHFRGFAVRKVLRVYRIGGAVSELLYAPALGFAPPSAGPQPYGRIGGVLAAERGTGGALWLFGGMVEVGDTEVAFDDLWRLSLGAKGGAASWECVRPPSTTKEQLRELAAAGGEAVSADESEDWEEDR